MLQWGHDFSAVEIAITMLWMLLCNSSFNGATTFQPWKFWRLPKVQWVKAASMGPRLFSRGNSALHGSWGRSHSGLQWGHDFSAVEISGERLEIIRASISFNGATTFQPWKLVSMTPISPPRLSFNGATTFQPWKFYHVVYRQTDIGR